MEELLEVPVLDPERVRVGVASAIPFVETPAEHPGVGPEIDEPPPSTVLLDQPLVPVAVHLRPKAEVEDD